MFLYLEGPCLQPAREIVRMQCGIKAPCANHADDGDLILTGSEAIQLWPSNGRVKTYLEQENAGKEEMGPLLLNAKILWSALFCKHSDPPM